MGKNNNFIDINGQRFDAASGKPVSQAAHRINTRHAGPAGQTMSDVVRQPGHHAKAHSPHASRTLMRTAVRKPGKLAKQRVNPAPNSQASVPVATDMVLTPAAKVQTARLQHARKVRQSKLISHFSPESQRAQPIAPPGAAKPAQPVVAPVQPMPAKPVQSHVHARPSAKHAKEAMLQRALERADSHERPPARKTPKRRSRGKLVAASVLLFLVVAGAGAFAVTQPETVKLAIISAKAGFRATNPAKQLSGYSLSRANYGEGTVTLQYKNNDGVTYTVTQTRTTMSDSELRQQLESAGSDAYKQVSASGKRIYIYDNQAATWIEDGRWYVIKSDGKLTDQQLTQIAASL